MSENVIEVKGVSKTFGGVVANKDISLNVKTYDVIITPTQVFTIAALCYPEMNSYFVCFSEDS